MKKTRPEVEIKKKKELTSFSKRSPDPDGCEVLEKLLELEGGKWRPPSAAKLLVQPVQQTFMNIVGVSVDITAQSNDHLIICRT